MSFSWAFIGDFKVPRDKVATVKAALPPWEASIEDIQEDPTQIVDWIYRDDGVEHRRIFEKSHYADALDALRTALGHIAAAGGTGRGAVVGFVDGGPTDVGWELAVADGKVTETALAGEDEVAKWNVSPQFEALVERVVSAFGDDDEDGDQN